MYVSSSNLSSLQDCTEYTPQQSIETIGISEWFKFVDIIFLVYHKFIPSLLYVGEHEFEYGRPNNLAWNDDHDVPCLERLSIDDIAKLWYEANNA